MYRLKFGIYYNDVSKRFFCGISSDFFEYEASSFFKKTKNAVIRDINKFIREALDGKSLYDITDYTIKGHGIYTEKE